MSFQSYKDLEIYQMAHPLAVEIDTLTTKKLPELEKYEEGVQIRKSSKSISSNIVEGFGRRRYKNEFIQFLTYALASCDETREHLNLLWDTGSLKDKELYQHFNQKYDELGKKITKFIQAVEIGHLTHKSSIQHPASSIQYPVSRKAFSLIEVAIAIAILALFFGGMLAIFERGAIASRKTQQQAVAYSLARAVLEESSNWGRLIALTGSNPPANGTYTNPPVLLNNITYTPQLAIFDGPINPTQLKRLEVTISWTDGTTPRNVTLASLKANY